VCLSDFPFCDVMYDDGVGYVLLVLPMTSTRSAGSRLLSSQCCLQSPTNTSVILHHKVPTVHAANVEYLLPPASTPHNSSCLSSVFTLGPQLEHS
jgi:hypothetical protein